MPLHDSSRVVWFTVESKFTVEDGPIWIIFSVLTWRNIIGMCLWNVIKRDVHEKITRTFESCLKREIRNILCQLNKWYWKCVKIYPNCNGKYGQRKKKQPRMHHLISLHYLPFLPKVIWEHVPEKLKQVFLFLWYLEITSSAI